MPWPPDHREGNRTWQAGNGPAAAAPPAPQMMAQAPAPQQQVYGEPMMQPQFFPVPQHNRAFRIPFLSHSAYLSVSLSRARSVCAPVSLYLTRQRPFFAEPYSLRQTEYSAEMLCDAVVSARQ